MTIRVKSLEEMFREVKATLQAGLKGRPAFTLLLGSGFSHPIIPTPTQMLNGDIAWWRFCKSRQMKEAFCYREEGIANGHANADEVAEFEREFWKTINVPLDASGRPDLTDPENIGRAYQAVMSDGLYSNGMRRQYLRDAIARSGPRINSAHLFLASILEAQESLSWPWGAPFCRTIFTTNFDPLLQRSLQLFNKLYFMTDRPNVLEPPDDDESPAIHLVYTHGSVHRYQLLNTDEQIGSAAKRNAASLVNYFQRHGVIVIGYSGWLDTTMEALGACASFDLNLYWCDMHAPEELESRLRPKVRELLHASSDAYYVPIHPGGADDAMQKFHVSLGLGEVPKFILNPVGTMVEQLNNIQLPSEPAAPSEQTSTSLTELLQNTLDALKAAQQAFADPSIVKATSEEAKAEISRAWVARLMNDAWQAASKKNHEQAIAFWSSVIAGEHVSAEDRARALVDRGISFVEIGKFKEGIDDYTTVIGQSDAPDRWRASALVARGFAYGKVGRTKEELDDYTTVLTITDVLPSIKAQALLNRGITNMTLDRPEQAIDDYSSLLSMVDAPASRRAGALLNRGVALGRLGRRDQQFADFSAVIAMPDAPAVEKAKALFNRALFHERDETAVEDYSMLIEMADAPELQRAKALVNRANAYRRMGRTEDALRDWSAVIEDAQAPSDQRARAHINRGMWERHSGRIEEASADFIAAVGCSDATAEVRATALVERARTYDLTGMFDEAITDLNAAIMMTEAPPNVRSDAFFVRGWQHFETKRDVTALINDSRSALEAFAENHAARANLALGLLVAGDVKTALEEYRKIPVSDTFVLGEAIKDIETELANGEIPGADQALTLLRNLSEPPSPA